MFDDIRHAFRELLHGNVPPEGRRELIVVMKDTLVQARLAMDDLREGVEVTSKRVERERSELETIRRRKGLAQSVGDAETVSVAERFETQQAERLAVLESKLNAQESELALVERDVAEMKEQLKAALAGDPRTKAHQVNVETHEGVVQLSGFVDSPEAKSTAEQLARAVDNVKSVDNELDVKR